MNNWLQYQANGPGQGFAPFSTGPTGSFKWKTEVGPVAFASPVLDPEGTVYIGNLKAELFAIGSNGAVKWKKTLAERGHTISASCSVDSLGNIYAVTSYRATVRDHRSGHTVTTKTAHSRLHSLTKDGILRWTVDFPLNNNNFYTNGFCLSAPKIYNQPNPIIFVPIFYFNIATNPKVELMAIDISGNLLDRTLVADYPVPPVEVTGGGFTDVFEAIWNFLNGAEFNPQGGPNLNELYGWAQPSLAIADFGRLASEPVIIVDDNYKQLAAYRWQGGRFVPLWSKLSNKRIRFCSSPAIFLSSLVASGQQDGSLELYDVLSGAEVWKPWYRSRLPIQSPPASFIGQIYVVSGVEVIQLHPDGKFINKRLMDSLAISAPVMSADRVFINGGDGLYSYSLDLKEETKTSDVLGGVSSPAIAPDGTVYAIDRNNTLWAFGGQRAVRRPWRDRLKSLFKR